MYIEVQYVALNAFSTNIDDYREVQYVALNALEINLKRDIVSIIFRPSVIYLWCPLKKNVDRSAICCIKWIRNKSKARDSIYNIYHTGKTQNIISVPEY